MSADHGRDSQLGEKSTQGRELAFLALAFAKNT